IVGGTPAAEGEFPYVVVLRLNGYLCGGSLIGRSYVLVAAHCLAFFNQTDVAGFYLLINTLSMDGGGPNYVTKRVKKFIIHPRFNKQFYNNDVALLVLSSPVAANSSFLNLPTNQAAATTLKPTTTNVSATIAGWGTTSFGGSVSSTLLKANVTILDNSICAAQYGTTFVGANMLCAAAPDTDTCQGDIGGPVIVNGVVVGITSFAVGCADPKYAGVYTRVSTYVTWIQTTQANNPG
ncbi:hypothetical protein DAPPUDRAFT_53218, partial [Daphnia pulex]